MFLAGVCENSVFWKINPLHLHTVKQSYLDKPSIVFKLQVVDPFWDGSKQFQPQAAEYKTEFFISLQKVHYPFVVFNPLCSIAPNWTCSQSWNCGVFWDEVDKLNSFEKIFRNLLNSFICIISVLANSWIKTQLLKYHILLSKCIFSTVQERIHIVLCSVLSFSNWLIAFHS